MNEVLVLGSSGFIRNQISFNEEQLLSFSGENTGNFVFQHAVCKLIDQTTIRCSEVEYPRYWEDIFSSGYKIAIMPAANHLRSDADWTGFNDFLEKIQSNLIVLGLGAQAGSFNNLSETVDALRKNKSVVRFCEILNDKAVFIGLRGAFSKRVADELGLRNASITGCPSLLLNESLNLGERIADGLSFVFSKIDRRSILKIAHNGEHYVYLNNKNNSNILNIERNLFDYCHKNNGYYIQQSGGGDQINATIGRFDRIRNFEIPKLIAPGFELDKLADYLSRRGCVFFSALDWIEFSKRLDISVGFRIHGAMVSIAAGVPGIVVTHDSRTEELADFMQIPRIAAIDVKSNSIVDLIKSVKFDAFSFNSNRMKVAKDILSVFRASCITPSSHLLRLSGESI